ncbi:hypothetical protein BS78_K136500 [Paspalum vaginatum]|uniref:Uncharacterized protein n=1 Tax=Paspalum vaginatum TaxID=158149 RepID=A0A9W7X8J6_9POAL|nr:hypothetical protein BS78_K136500 [Paspalum vaginatum]
MKKKLKIEAEILQKEYEKAMQSRRSRRHETSHGKPSPAPGGKAPVNMAKNNLTTAKGQLKKALENEVDAESRSTMPKWQDEPYSQEGEEKKAVSKAGDIRWSSSEGSGLASRHATSERMSISTEEPEEFQTSSTHRPVLLLDSQLVPRSQNEAKSLRLLHQKSYTLTKCFNEGLLVSTGMRDEFDEVFQALGWGSFAEIPEGGIVLLTKEFLMTLRTDTRREGTFVWFRLFNTDYELTLRQFSNLLDFSPQCLMAEEPIGFNSVEF